MWSSEMLGHVTRGNVSQVAAGWIIRTSGTQAQRGGSLFCLVRAELSLEVCHPWWFGGEERERH